MLSNSPIKWTFFHASETNIRYRTTRSSKVSPPDAVYWASNIECGAIAPTGACLNMMQRLHAHVHIRTLITKLGEGVQTYYPLRTSKIVSLLSFFSYFSFKNSREVQNLCLIVRDLFCSSLSSYFRKIVSFWDTTTSSGLWTSAHKCSKFSFLQGLVIVLESSISSFWLRLRWIYLLFFCAELLFEKIPNNKSL